MEISGCLRRRSLSCHSRMSVTRTVRGGSEGVTGSGPRSLSDFYGFYKYLYVSIEWLKKTLTEDPILPTGETLDLILRQKRVH